MTSQASTVELVRAVLAALERFAQALSDGEGDGEPAAEPPPRPADEHALGKRQLQIVELPGIAAEEGLRTAEIAAAIEYELPNTYSTLQALARNGVVELVPGREPQHWRLARRYRAGSRAFARAAAVLGPGEWTTPGDVSIAVRGDLRAADAVARAGLSLRVVFPESVAADARSGLEAEGVAFLDDGQPDPRQRVAWDELRRRASAVTERRAEMANGTLNYLQVPATDLDRSATFYQEVFGWRISRSPSVALTDLQPQTGYVGFTDASGHVGGEFVLDRPASREPGLLPSIHVDDIDETLRKVTASGGEVVVPRTAIVESSDWQAVLRDPAGNAFALYESAS